MSNSLIATVAHAEIQKGIEARRKAYLKADQSFQEQTKEHYRTLDAFEARFAEKAFSIACEHGVPPLSADGTCKQPSTVTVEADGILLSWKGDDLACRSHKVTWDDLDKSESIPEPDS